MFVKGIQGLNTDDEAEVNNGGTRHYSALLDRRFGMFGQIEHREAYGEGAWVHHLSLR